MKKIVSVIIAVLILSTGVFGASFGDVSGHWAESYIEKWVYNEKINGYPDGTFKPDANITRAEYVKLLASLLPNMPYGEDVLYEDVLEGNWFYKSVQKLITVGALKNTGLFRPSETINRLEVMTLAAKAFSMESEAELTFADAAEIPDDAKPYVSALVEMGIVSGYEDNTIRPLRSVTRAEVIKILDGFGYVYEKDSLEGIMDRIYAAAYEEKPSVMYTRVDDESAQYFLGLENLTGIVEALGSEPMVSAQAHSVCLIRAKDGVDIEALKEKIRTSVDPRKWVCVGVDKEDVIVTNEENLILLVMDSNRAEKIARSFAGIFPKPETLENGIILYDGYYMETPGEFSEKSIKNFSEKLSAFFATQGVDNAVFSLVPGKNYYINDKLASPFDYEKMDAIIKENLRGVKFVDLYDSLSLDDYIKSDLHWKQNDLQKVLSAIGSEMGFSIDLGAYTKNEIQGFKGYYSQKAENVPAESIFYLTNDVTDKAVVDHFSVKDFKGIYNASKLSGKDPYNFFLSGAAPIITINNSLPASDRELIIMGDSFALSIAPLLLEAYKSVTIVDIRMVSTKIINDYVSFDGKDVLALYSDRIINNSIMLKF